MNNNFTFEQLPNVVEQIYNKLLGLEALLLTMSGDLRAKPEAKDILAIKEAAELLNLSVSSIYVLVHKKVIPVCKRGKRLYFSKDDLLRWIKEGRKKTAKEIDAEAESHLLQLNSTARRRAA
jgi:excisionase family DNA binding protein